MRFACTALVLVCSADLLAQDAVERAVRQMQSGDLPSAEQTIRAELNAHPDDLPALSVLAAVLDQEKKLAEADSVYRRALTLDPRSAALRNNFGNHLLSTGKKNEARQEFLKVLAVDPHHANALVHLAAMALDEHRPAEAAQYLARLTGEAANHADVALLRMRADYALGRQDEAAALLARLREAAQPDAQQTFALAQAVAAAQQYPQAEALFQHVLELQPDRFDALYDLGLASARAGDTERARQSLEQAHSKQPDNIDVLYDLAAIDVKSNRLEPALELLARARKLAPGRADIAGLLARATAQIGDFGDSVEAWTAYLNLQPQDEVARRERAFAEAAIARDEDQALADLDSFSRRHPNDATGRYELGVALGSRDPVRADQEFTRAVALKPHFASAYLARGLVRYRQGRTPDSLLDFEKAAQEDPQNPAALERLGQTYLALDRTGDAVRVLRKAAGIAPDRAGIELQLGRALVQAGKPGEAAPAFARYRELSANQPRASGQSGFVEFLSLSPEEQTARYRAGVERAIEANPANAEAEVRYLGLLLHDRKFADAAAVARKIAGIDPRPALRESAARLLLEARQYAAVIELARDPSGPTPDLTIDLALATAHAATADEALKLLDNARSGDQLLARAELLAIDRQPDAASVAARSAVAASPTRTDLYRTCAVALFKQGRPSEALLVLSKAVAKHADDSDLASLQALVSAANGAAVERTFTALEQRWPESQTVWLAHAFVLASEQKTDEARHALDAAKSVGAQGEAVAQCEAAIANPPDPESGRALLIRGADLLFG